MTIDEAKARQLESAGQKDKALKAYTMLGRFKDAARVAWELKRHDEAADLALKGGLYYEAAMCFIEGRDFERALNCLLRVRVDHSRYRESAARAAQIAAKSGRIDVRLDSFLGPWFADAPKNAGEMDALVDLARLYAKQGYRQIAMDALRKVAERDAHHRDAAALLEALKSGRPLPVSGPMPRAPSRSEVSGEELVSEEEFQALYAGAESTLIRRFGNEPSQEQPAVVAGTPIDAEPKETTAISTLAPGALIGNRYKLIEHIGKGAAAIVFKARDQDLKIDVAMKIFTSTLEGEEAEERFRREVQVSRQLAHPNIVRVFDMGHMDKHKFMTMELLSGSDLETYIQKRGRLSVAEGLPMLVELCTGLEYAHAQNIVHRDIKPSNIHIDESGHVKIMDFGIAKQRHAKGLTMTGQFMGTPEYMAPEQITDFANAGFAADLYSVGIVAYEMFTGDVPFTHKDVMGLLMMHLTEKPKPPSTINPTVTKALDDAILKLLAKDPQQRFASAADVAGELEIIQAL